MRRRSRIISLTLTGFAALFGHFLISPVHGQNLALRGDAAPIARITEPYGEAVKDISAINDGIINESYDSYDGANVAGEDWYGYIWMEYVYFDKLLFYEGAPSQAGGYWKSLTVQYTMDGINWIDAGVVAISPQYNFSDTATRVPYTRYELTFTGCLGNGVRIYGQPGGPAFFTSIAELEVYGTKPALVCTRWLPTSYQSGLSILVSLSVDVLSEPPPSSLIIVENIPAGLTVSDPGTGDTSQPGQISWTLGQGQLANTVLDYSLSIPGAHTGVINFSGTLTYPGANHQKITGGQTIAPAPLPPSPVQASFDVDARISWVQSTQQGIAGYRVYRSEEGADFTDISGLIRDSNYMDFFVEFGKSYRYKIITQNTTGASSDPADSEPTNPGGPSMLRRQFEDYNFDAGDFPGGPSQRGFAARYRSDLVQRDFFYQNDTESNEYRPLDLMAIPAFNAQEHYLGNTSPNDWWKYTFEVPHEGFVRVGAIRAASEGDVIVEFLWDDSHEGWFSFNTGGRHNWQIIPVNTPAFHSSPGPHTLRVMLSVGSADFDYFGIGFQQPDPSRVTIFSEDFERYTTTDDLTSGPNGWTIQSGSGVPEGAWQLWSTTGPPLGYESADLSGMTGKYVVSDGEFAGPVDLDEQLISPEIDCSQYVKVTAQFGSNINIYERDVGVDEQAHDLDVATYDEITHTWSEWTNVFHHEGKDGDDSSPPLVDISILANGKKIKLRWRFWKTNYDYWWAVDNIRVTGELPAAPPARVLSAKVAENKISLTWESFATGLYRVQYTDNLPSGIWVDVPGYPWPVTETQWSGDNVSAARSRFYRVVSE